MTENRNFNKVILSHLIHDGTAYRYSAERSLNAEQNPVLKDKFISDDGINASRIVIFERNYYQSGIAFDNTQFAEIRLYTEDDGTIRAHLDELVSLEDPINSFGFDAIYDEQTGELLEIRLQKVTDDGDDLAISMARLTLENDPPERFPEDDLTPPHAGVSIFKNNILMTHHFTETMTQQLSALPDIHHTKNNFTFNFTIHDGGDTFSASLITPEFDIHIESVPLQLPAYFKERMTDPRVISVSESENWFTQLDIFNLINFEASNNEV